nr:13323_t:CDS:2 [Entrophospora candida]
MMCKNKNTGLYAVENCKENEKGPEYVTFRNITDKAFNKLMNELSGEYSLDDIKINITENGILLSEEDFSLLVQKIENLEAKKLKIYE